MRLGNITKNLIDLDDMIATATTGRLQDLAAVAS